MIPKPKTCDEAIYYLLCQCFTVPMHGNGIAINISHFDFTILTEINSSQWSCKDDGFLDNDSDSYICFEDIPEFMNIILTDSKYLNYEKFPLTSNLVHVYKKMNNN
jgi:hypothetical protein